MKIVILFLFIAITSPYLMYGQSNPCSPGNPDITWQFNRLDYVPPLSVYMPIDAILGYIAVDSIRRSIVLEDLQEFLERQTYNDTTKYIMRFYYQMVDYDPIKYALFENFGDYATCPVPLIEYEVSAHIYQTCTNKGDYLLIKAHYIAHVKISDTYNFTDTTSLIYPRGVNVTCEILDTIKGMVIPACYDLNQYSTNKSNGTQALPTDCIQFTYALDWPRGNMDGYESIIVGGTDGYSWTGVKPKLIDSLGNEWIQKDKEYIVFLKPVIACETDSSVYYSIYPVGGGFDTYGLYPINNGIVYDPNNDFGFGNNLTTAVFKERLRARIQDIINFNN